MTLPQRTKASLALAKSERFAGDLSSDQLPRLAVLLAEPAVVQVSLRCRPADPFGRLEGRVSASLQLRCSRCSGLFSEPLDVDTTLTLVETEEDEERLLADCEPVLILHDELPLYQLIEDELLLALPMMPRCAACEAEVEHAAPQVLGEAVETEQRSPFAVLKNLKK